MKCGNDMEKWKATKEEKERNLAFLLHILKEIKEYSIKNDLDATDTAITIAEYIIWMFKKESDGPYLWVFERVGKNETGSTRDKYQGTGPKLDQ